MSVIRLYGRIDSNNASLIENEIMEQLASADVQDSATVELDAEDLEYISSAGLRVLLRIRKTHPDMVIRNVTMEVYDILEMTGFTEMMDVQRAYRVV